MRVQVLGDVEVTRDDGSACDLGGPKQRALLALLVAAEGRTVSVERLVDQLWPDGPPDRVVASIQVYVAKLRRELEPSRSPRAASRVLVTRSAGYALATDAVRVDAVDFARLLGEAQQTAGRSPEEALDRLGDALALWRGEPYSGLTATADTLAAEATRLEELRLTAVELQQSLRIDLGDHAGAAATLGPLVAEHPLRERLWGLLALALYRSDRQADALEAVRRARRLLDEELGLDLSPELRHLEEAMLRQDPKLAGRRAEPAGAPAAPVAAPVPPATAGVPLLGRADELRATAEVLDQARTGRSRVVLVTGEPGIGKSRLASAVLEQGRTAGFRTGSGTWEPEPGPPLWGWTQALRGLHEGVDLLSDLEQGAHVDAGSATFRTAEHIVGLLRAAAPALLVLDDVQWADPDSHRVLRRVAATLGPHPVVLVVLTRDAVADATAALTETRAALARLDPVRLHLHGLDVAAVREHVARETGVTVGEDAAQALLARTDGNPFFVNELVRLLVGSGALADPRGAPWQAVPEGVRDVVRSRTASLSDATRRLLGAAAVLGQSFDTDVLEAMVGLEPEVFDECLEAAQVSALVDERAPGSYRFAHALVRDAVYEELLAPVRARAHARAGQALEERRVGRLQQYAGEVGEHYRLAGPAHARSAWTHTASAAEQAERRAAYEDALELFSAAEELQELDPLVEPVERERVWTGKGRSLNRLTLLDQAWQALRQAAESALARGDAAHAVDVLMHITERSIWTWREHLQVDEPAIALWEQLLERLPEGDLARRAQVEAALAVELIYSLDGQPRALRLADEALAKARRLDDDVLLRRVLTLAGLALTRPRTLHRRLALSEELLRVSERLGGQLDLGVALCLRATDLVEVGEWQEGIAHWQRAHAIAAEQQVVPLLLISGWGLALDLQAQGRFDEALARVAELEDLQSTVSMAGVGIGLAQTVLAHGVQGRWADTLESVRAAAPVHPLFRDLTAKALVETGQLDEARAFVGPWRDQPPIVEDFMWIARTMVRASVWAALGDPEAVADLSAQLEPYAERVAIGGMAVHGCVSHALGELALARGDAEAAAGHLRRSVSVLRRCGLGPWEEQSARLLERLPAGAPGAVP